MASEVIELGSSDDEAEPTSKKMKPVPNAMVRFPKKISGTTIKPATHLIKINKCDGKLVPITKNSNFIFNHNLPKRGAYGKRDIFAKQTRKHVQIPIGNSSLLNNQGLEISIAKTVNLNKPINLSNNVMKIEGAGCLSNLPPTITIKRTKTAPKRVASPNMANNVKKKLKINKDVLIVDLIEDNTATSSSPQWYIRPEELTTESTALKEQNNVEPDKSKCIEIIIEDSPVKPEKNKKTCLEGTDLSIIIEDSPNKPDLDKKAHPNSSDEKNSVLKKIPHSKKKLQYPNSQNNDEMPKLIEVQLTPLKNYKNDAENLCLKEQQIHIDPDIVEIEESPLKFKETIQPNTLKKESVVKPSFNNADHEMATEKKDNVSEFNSVYQSFIDLCLELENSEDMKIIVEKKIKAYYRQVPKDYTESEDFIDMVSSKISAMKAGPEKLYLYIKDIVDELNFKRKSMKSQISPETSKDTEMNNHLHGESSEYDSKRQRQIRRLEKTLKKLHRAIQKLEEQEVDFDDEEDSVYLLTERYKERLVRVHAKLCQLTNTKMPSEPHVQIDPRPGQPKGPAKRLEKWINRKVPIGTPLSFPDFHDVLRCVRDANKQDNLGWNEVDVMDEARDLFTRCGKKLKRRRQENEWRLAVSRISVVTDPAEKDEELKLQLHKNSQIAAQKETELLKKFADKQNLLKLEAEEIGDKEAEESPLESDDEEANADDTSLTTEKRKERLKRLIHEKAKKPTAESSHKITQSVELKDMPSTHSDNNNKEQNALQPNNRINEENNEQDSRNSINKNECTDANLNEVIISDTVEVQANNSKLEQEENMYISADNVQLLSDDSNKIESDIDELHLLQKLHSKNEINSSTSDSSDSDSPIAISDTLDSNSNDKSDVISIENSSYSEADDNIENQNPALPDIDQESVNVEEEVNTNKQNKYIKVHNEKYTDESNNVECNDYVENILLASSEEDEVVLHKDLTSKGHDVPVNSKDDAISIGETVVQGLGDTESERKCVDIAVADENDETNIAIMHSDGGLVQDNNLDSDSSRLKENGADHEVLINNTNNEQLSNDEIIIENIKTIEITKGNVLLC